MKSIYLLITGLLIGILITIPACIFGKCRERIYSLVLDNYQECAKAGFPVVSGDFLRCYVGQDTVFVGDRRVPPEEFPPLVSESVRFDPLSEITEKIPETVRLNVPFTPQAPFADWNDLFNEACEEAALLMAEYSLRGDELSREEASSEIVSMTEWETKNSYDVDVSVEKLSEIARKYYHRDSVVYADEKVTKENIMKLLVAGYPVIIPAAGQHLGNPYFRGDGPPYHMLVLTGYDSKYFYTNDPGTRRGENYSYSHEIIMNAIHDWTGSKDTIRTGRKAMMILGLTPTP